MCVLINKNHFSIHSVRFCRCLFFLLLGGGGLRLALALERTVAYLAVDVGPRQRRGNAAPNDGAAGAAPWRGGDAKVLRIN